MVSYPVTVARSSYRGTDRRKSEQAAEHNRDASTLEDYCNHLIAIQKAATQSYDWWEIARGCGLPVARVATLGYSIDGGSSGFTAIRKGLTYDQAIAESSRA